MMELFRGWKCSRWKCIWDNCMDINSFSLLSPHPLYIHFSRLLSAPAVPFPALNGRKKSKRRYLFLVFSPCFTWEWASTSGSGLSGIIWNELREIRLGCSKSSDGRKRKQGQKYRWEVGGLERMLAHSGIWFLIINASEQQQRLSQHTEILSAIQGCDSRTHQHLVIWRYLLLSSRLIWRGASGVIYAVSFSSIFTFSTLVSWPGCSIWPPSTKVTSLVSWRTNSTDINVLKLTFLAKLVAGNSQSFKRPYNVVINPHESSQVRKCPFFSCLLMAHVFICQSQLFMLEPCKSDRQVGSKQLLSPSNVASKVKVILVFILTAATLCRWGWTRCWERTMFEKSRIHLIILAAFMCLFLHHSHSFSLLVWNQVHVRWICWIWNRLSLRISLWLWFTCQASQVELWWVCASLLLNVALASKCLKIGSLWAHGDL